MKIIYATLAVLWLTGCASLSPYLPTAISVGKILYCEAKDEDERAAIRDRYGLPHVVYCPEDTR